MLHSTGDEGGDGSSDSRGMSLASVSAWSYMYVNWHLVALLLKSLLCSNTGGGWCSGGGNSSSCGGGSCCIDYCHLKEKVWKQTLNIVAYKLCTFKPLIFM